MSSLLHEYGLFRVPGGRTLTTHHESLDIAIKKVGNRYLTTMLIAKRIRQLSHGVPALVQCQEGESHFSIAVREIAEGLVAVGTPPDELAVRTNGAVNATLGGQDDETEA
jgi:DNA-directed RNA polymerase omega subunit